MIQKGDSLSELFLIPFVIESQREFSVSKSYSEDLRQRIVDAVDGGVSRRQAAEHYDVSVSSAIRYARRWRETGSVQAAAMGAPRRSKLDPHGDWLLTQIDDTPDLTLEEIIARLGSERGVKSSIGGLWNFFHRHGISFKKNRARGRAGTS